MDASELITRKDLFEVEDRISKKIDQLKNQDSGAKRWLRTSDVSKMLNLSSSSIQTLRISSILPYTKVGGTLFYNVDDIEELLAKNKSTNQ